MIINQKIEKINKKKGLTVKTASPFAFPETNLTPGMICAKVL